MARDSHRPPGEVRLESSARVAAVVSRYHADLTGAMLASAESTLKDAGLHQDLEVVWVPGAFELPIVAQRFARRQDIDAVLCIGVIIKGETRHDEFIAQGVVSGLVNASMETGTPCLMGVLTCETLEQAQARALGKDRELDKGIEIGRAAVEVLAALEQAKSAPSTGALGFAR